MCPDTRIPIDGMPQFPLFDLAQRSEVFVIDDNVMLGAPKKRGARVFGKWGPRTFELAQMQSRVGMSEDYIQRHRKALVYGALEQLDIAPFSADYIRHADGLASELDDISFVCRQLIPRLREISGQGRETLMPVSQEELRQVVGTLTIQLQRLMRVPFFPSLHWGLFPDKWALLEGNLYHLVRKDSLPRKLRPSFRNNRVKLTDGDYVLIMQGSSTGEVMERFQQSIGAQIMDHLRLCLPSLMQTLKDMDDNFVSPVSSRIRRLTRHRESADYLYDSPTYCVFKWDGVWRLGLGLGGQYVMEDGSNSLYLMEDGMVSVPIVTGDYPLGAPLVHPGRYQHPFVSTSNGRDVCIGDYATRQLVIDELRRLAPVDRLMAYLKDVRGTLLSGYHSRNAITPFRHLHDIRGRCISREEAERRKLRIYPYYRR